MYIDLTLTRVTHFPLGLMCQSGVVHTDSAMQRWKEEDKELVINTLTERASGM
jgi:hypothetical protein